MASQPKQRLVVVGNGMAPGRALERLFETNPDAYEVTIFNAEPRVNYDRIMLSPVLSGEKSFEEIVIHGDGWYVKHGVTLYKGAKVTTIDRTARTVTAEFVPTGNLGNKPLEPTVTVPYDKLIIGTGSNPIILPVPGHDLPGVLTYRDLDDVEAMLLAAQGKGDAVVIGGGLLGLEAAAGLKEQGMDVTVLHLMPTLMERQLDIAAAALLYRDLEARGIAFFTNSQTEEIAGTEAAEAIVLADGRRIPADFVVVAIGVRPNIDLARAAGLDVNRGILVGDDMATSDPDICAIGECIEHNGQVFGLIAPIWEQAKVCGARLAGEDTVYVPPPPFTSLKITGVDVFSAGTLAAADEAEEEITLHDAKRGLYKKVILRDDRVVGSVLYGGVADGPWYVDLMRGKVDVSSFRDQLVFGHAFAERAALPQVDSAATADTDGSLGAAEPQCQAA